MDDAVVKSLADLAANLTALAVKGTVSSVDAKIKSIKLEKNLEEVKNKYDEIINELLSEREEAVRIAQVYKSEVERYQISDDDISHLHKTVETLLGIVQNINPAMDTQSLEQIKNLISVDTLKSIQLLGFNYKEAIGEPLTSICANAIRSWGSQHSSNKQGSNNTQQSSNNKKR